MERSFTNQQKTPFCAAVFTTLVLASVLVLAACPTRIDEQELTLNPDELINPDNYMVSVRGATVSVTVGTRAFKAATDTPVTVANFKIGKTEVPYTLWYEVREWAKTHGYTFANEGKEGKGGTSGAPTDKQFHPVTNINFRDMVVWCNAYSEKNNKTPVYYEEGTATVLKTAEGLDTAAESGKAELADIKADADGYRLPTQTEWEFAARGGDPSDSANWQFIYAGSDDAGAVGWYQPNSGGSTNVVAQKSPNSRGLYDMSGNVYERVQDKSGSSRLICGGYWNNPIGNLKVDYGTTSGATTGNDNTGFRPAANN